MRILISPAKRMRVEPDRLPCEGAPLFQEEAGRLREALRALDDAGLQRLWRCNDAIAARSIEELRGRAPAPTPALFAFEGIQYQYMAPDVFDAAQLDYLRAHLRILSGLYGLLRPFDAVTPYRLEMGARLAAEGERDLYGFWGERLARRLAQETDLLLDLASREYSRAATERLPGRVRHVRFVFGEQAGGKIVEKGTLCKMARGRMVRYLAERQIVEPEGARDFQELGYAFSPAHSQPDKMVFLKRENRGGAVGFRG